jgi:cytoskeleton protein RodZ
MLMGSVNQLKELPNNQPDEEVLVSFKDVGQILQDARKEQNLSIKQVASKIHIRQRYLIDLEEGQLDDLPGRVYIFGFIRTYARFLSLDGEELIRRIITLPDLNNPERNRAPIPTPSEEDPSYITLGVSAIIILILSICGYFFLRSPLKEVPSPIDIKTTIPSPIQVRTEVESPESLSQITNRENKQAPQAKNEVLQASQGHPTQDIPKIIYPKDMPTIGETRESTAIGQNSQEPAKLDKQIRIKANEPSWVEIRDETNRVIFMRVMKRGEEYVVPENPDITISTGNAGGITIFVGPNPLPSLGNRGDVKRGIKAGTLRQ